jgi:cysteine desulfurase
MLVQHTQGQKFVTAMPIYLDGFSTLPLAPEAQSALVEACSMPGNAASPHGAGARAAKIIENARSKIADLIGAAPSELIFTSGATEANNLAILGVARAVRMLGGGRRRILVSAIEHKAVLEPAQTLAAEGFEIEIAPVDNNGRLDLDRFAALVAPETLLVSVMAVNNETGVIQPVAEAAAIAHEAGALFHCDAAQAVGKIPIDVGALDVDYLSLSAHKCYGPMGIGALYVSAAAPTPQPLQFGGGQQNGTRPGTEPVALIAGFGAAVTLAREQFDADRRHGSQLAERLVAELNARQLRFDRITGDHEVVPGSLALSIQDADAETLCIMLGREVHLSTGSACTSGQLRMSHVLEAMGFSEDEGRSVLRMFCNRYTTDKDVEVAAERIVAAVTRSRLAPGGLRQ